MVKGITKQIIVVHAPEQEMFEQAIFILKEDAVRQGVTDEQLLKEAKKAVRVGQDFPHAVSGPLWACLGAVVTGFVWLLTNFL